MASTSVISTCCGTSWTKPAARDARPTVVTFDHHPDEVLTGHAPPLLIAPDERLERLAAAGVDGTVVQHFDAALRQTPYDAFVERIRARTAVAGFLMTPDAAFGFERRGTPEALASLGERHGFEVVVVPPFALGGRPVRSTDVRTAITSGDLAQARALLGRPVTLRGSVDATGRLRFELPMALPPDGTYRASIAGTVTDIDIRDGAVRLDAPPSSSHVSLELLAT